MKLPVTFCFIIIFVSLPHGSAVQDFIQTLLGLSNIGDTLGLGNIDLTGGEGEKPGKLGSDEIGVDGWGPIDTASVDIDDDSDEDGRRVTSTKHKPAGKQPEDSGDGYDSDSWGDDDEEWASWNGGGSGGMSSRRGQGRRGRNRSGQRRNGPRPGGRRGGGRRKGRRGSEEGDSDNTGNGNQNRPPHGGRGWRKDFRAENGRPISGYAEDLLDGISGPKRTGDSCLTKPRLRDPSKGHHDFNIDPRAVIRGLRMCDRNILKFSVDTNLKQISGAQDGGCVYREPDRGINHWAIDPNALLSKPLSTKEARDRKRMRMVPRYDCGPEKGPLNLIAVATEKEYCRRLYNLAITPSCDACELLVVYEEPDALKKCIANKLDAKGGPQLVVHFANECLRKMSENKRRC